MISFELERTGDARFAVRIPPDCALFDGHFPGAPVLPGVAQLGLVLQAVRARRGERTRLARVEHLRLRLPVGPGDRLELELAGDDRVDFVLARAGRRVAYGTLHVEDGR